MLEKEVFESWTSQGCLTSETCIETGRCQPVALSASRCRYEPAGEPFKWGRRTTVTSIEPFLTGLWLDTCPGSVVLLRDLDWRRTCREDLARFHGCRGEAVQGN